MHFVSLLAFKGYVRHMLRCILKPRWHGRGFVNTCDTFCGLTGMGGVSSTLVVIHFVASLAWEGFEQQKLRYNLCLSWLGMGSVNTFLATFYFLTGMRGLWSTQVETHFLYSLAWAGFGKHILRCIFCARCYGMGLVNTC
jgi:hypothetical protein